METYALLAIRPCFYSEGVGQIGKAFDKIAQSLLDNALAGINEESKCVFCGG